MLSDDLRARVAAYADREWPHDETLGADVCAARAVRRLTFRQGVEWAMSHTVEEDVLDGHLVVPRPHVPFGPQGVPELIADATYLDHAASNLEGKFEVGGSNVRATVVRLLRDVALALRAAHRTSTEDHADRSRG